MTGIKNALGRHTLPLAYGSSLAGLLFLLHWLECRFVLFDPSLELYTGLIALLFTALGVWLAVKLAPPKVETVVVQKEVYVRKDDDVVLNTAAIAERAISKRELEILQLMAQGHSNGEIAAALFVSLSTVKTHNQNIFSKLDVKRRTQAVETAKRLRIIP